MKENQNKIIYLFLALFFIFLDQFSKYIIHAGGGFYICNQNLAFGLSPTKIIFLLLGIFAIIIIVNFKFKISNFKSIFNFKILTFFKNLKLKIENSSTTNLIATTFIISGALSNITDRLYLGCVIDFIDLGFWPVFNLADIFITIGVIFIIFNSFSKKQT